MMKYIYLFAVLILVSKFGSAQTWLETQPAGNNNENWYTTSMSPDGSKIIAGVYGGRIYISVNGGNNWTETTDFPGGVSNKNWHTSAISSDGNTIIAGVYGGRLYMTANGGIWWWEAQPAGAHNENWATASMSSDGNRIIAGAEGGRLYISTDKGYTWSETQPAGNNTKYWLTTSMSPDGSKIIAGVYGGRIYISVNGGNNWTETTNFPGGVSNKNWTTTSISSNGDIMIAGVGGGRLYMTDNGGIWWWEAQPAGANDKQWRTAKLSSDGLKVIAGASGGRLYYSDNKGFNWTETDPAGSGDKNWQTVSISSDASKVIAGVYGGRLYMNTTPLPIVLTWNEVQPAGNLDKNWNTAKISSDGNIIIAGVHGGRLYLSTNGGTSWAETQPGGNQDYNWQTSAMSSDGNKILVSVGAAQDDPSALLYYTSNRGTNWINISDDITGPGPNAYFWWRAIAMSSDGNKIIAGSPCKWFQGLPSCCGFIYTSTNGATNWVQTYPHGQYYTQWWTTSMSSDGSTIIAGVDGGRLYITNNSGNSWTETTNFPPSGTASDKNWVTTKMNSSGSIMIAGVHNGRLYMTDNGGVWWWEAQPAGSTNKNWQVTAMSSDGFNIIAGIDGGRLYYSTDKGITWAETQPAGSNDKSWCVSAMNSDATKIIVGVNGGRLYINDRPLPVTLQMFSGMVQENTVRLSWQTSTEINNRGFDVERKKQGRGYRLEGSGEEKLWEKIGNIEGHGTKNTPTDYTFEDRNLNAGKYAYRLKQVDFNGNYEYHNLSSVVEVGVPVNFKLGQNYPNPFNPSTKIEFQLPSDSRVSLVIYDVTGREIKRLINDEFRRADYYTEIFKASGLSTGAYFYRLIAGKLSVTKKMIFIN